MRARATSSCSPLFGGAARPVEGPLGAELPGLARRRQPLRRAAPASDGIGQQAAAGAWPGPDLLRRRDRARAEDRGRGRRRQPALLHELGPAEEQHPRRPVSAWPRSATTGRAWAASATRIRRWARACTRCWHQPLHLQAHLRGKRRVGPRRGRARPAAGPRHADSVAGVFSDGQTVRDWYTGKSAVVSGGKVQFELRAPVALIALD
jgi:hypothetical protein